MARKKLYKHTFLKSGTFVTKEGREVHSTKRGFVLGPKEMFDKNPDIETTATKAFIDAAPSGSSATTDTADEQAETETKKK